MMRFVQSYIAKSKVQVQRTLGFVAAIDVPHNHASAFLRLIGMRHRSHQAAETLGGGSSARHRHYATERADCAQLRERGSNSASTSAIATSVMGALPHRSPKTVYCCATKSFRRPAASDATSRANNILSCGWVGGFSLTVRAGRCLRSARRNMLSKRYSFPLHIS